MIRKCFFSFHFRPDVSRVSQVRNIGMIEGNRPAHDNDWETIVAGGDLEITNWIKDQMKGKSCAIVLVGENTANRKWINHEIAKAWNDKMGVVGIRIHGLKDFSGSTSQAGENPFAYINFGLERKPLSTVVKCYNPVGSDSKERYAWISEHLTNAVEEAIKIRADN